MRNTGKLLLMLFFVAQIGCTKEQAVNEYDVNPILKAKVLLASKSSEAVKLQFCNEIPFKWDSIIILPPYSSAETVRKQNVANPKAIEKMFPELTLDEGRCVLLFIQGDNIVRYAFVPRDPLDFNDLVGPDKASQKISKETACGKIYIKRDNSKLSLSY